MCAMRVHGDSTAAAGAGARVESGALEAGWEGCGRTLAVAYKVCGALGLRSPDGVLNSSDTAICRSSLCSWPHAMTHHLLFLTHYDAPLAATHYAAPLALTHHDAPLALTLYAAVYRLGATSTLVPVRGVSRGPVADRRVGGAGACCRCCWCRAEGAAPAHCEARCASFPTPCCVSCVLV